MSTPTNVRFGDMRQHMGSQHRAWEELAYLLVHDLDSLPRNTPLTRRGTPDGGVEFSCPAPIGHGSGTWAWQAKYLFDFKPATFSQMRRSFLDALKGLPNLSRYTFVLPEDRPDGGQGTSAMSKWHEHVANWRRLASDVGVTVDIEFHGHSDVLKALLLPAHAGALRYFFDATFLTPDVLSGQVHRAVKDLGRRYTPDLNVDTAFPALVDGLCLESEFTDKVAELATSALTGMQRAASAVAAAARTDRPGIADLLAIPCEELNRCFSLCRVGLDRRQTEGFDALRRALATCKRSLVAQRRALDTDTRERSASRAEHAAESARPGGESAHGAPSPPPISVEEWVRDADLAVRLAHELLNSAAAVAAESRAALVVGPAGCGKSHSIADVATRRTGVGSPTALVLGQNLSTNTSLGSEVARYLDLDANWKELLQSLDVAASVRGEGRALLVIDAINEGPGADLWRSRLAGLLRDIASHSMVAVLVTVRDTYEGALVTPESADGLVRHEHPGLAGREDEAIHLYAAHYDLSVPDIPPLQPEFTNPLLLQSICRAARARGRTALPGTTMGQGWIFDGLLDAVNAEVSSRLDLDAYDRVSQLATEALAERMLDEGAEVLSFGVARDICRQIHDDRGAASKSLVNALAHEGLLLRETAHMLNEGDPPQERVRFTWQRMGDHLRAQVLIRRHPSKSALKKTIAEMVPPRPWRHLGLLDALSVLVPQSHHGTELVDLLRKQPWFDDVRYEMGESLLESLAWREPSAVTDRTIETVRNLIAKGSIASTDWLNKLISLACVPDHPLSVDFLHERLSTLTLIEREELWTQPCIQIWFDDINPIARTIDWLWANDRPLTPKAAEQASLLLTWMLTSSSRRLRDSATKVLVELLDERPTILVHLLTEFAEVNDTYVRERLLAVALGHVARLPSTNLPPQRQAYLVALNNASITIASRPEDAPHALITHYVKSVTAEVGRRLPDTDLREFHESSVPWPLDPPSLKVLGKALGCPGDRYLVGSPVGYDFRRYILGGSRMRDFVQPHQTELKQRRKANGTRRYRNAVNRLAELTGRSQHEIESELEDRRSFTRRDRTKPWEPPPPTKLDELRAAHPDLVRRAEAARHDMRTDQPVALDGDMLERVIIARTLDLGWLPTDGGGPDRRSWRPSERRGGQDKVERIGKKFSWIAYHELLAALAQHCLVQDWTDELLPYTSPWQLSFVNDIDPTVTIRGDVPPPDSASARFAARIHESSEQAWWLEGLHRSPLATTDNPDDDWLRTRDDLPDPRRVLSVSDPHGGKWLVLESHTEWQINTPGAAYESGPHRRDLWLRTQSYLLPKSGVAEVKRWSKNRNWMGLWMPTPPDYGLGHYRQYPHGAPWSAWHHQILKERSGHEGIWGPPPGTAYDPDTFDGSQGWTTPRARDFPRVPIALSTFGRNVSSDNDMSSKEMPRCLLPAPVLLEIMNAEQARWSPERDNWLGLTHTEREYCWESSGTIMMFATDGREWGAPGALFIRADLLEAALQSKGLSWWTWILGEKIVWQRGEPTSVRLDIFGAAGLREGEVDLWSLDTRYHGPEQRERWRSEDDGFEWDPFDDEDVD